MMSRRASTIGTWAAILLALGIGFGNGPLLIWGLGVLGLLAAALSIRPAHEVTARVAVGRDRPRLGDVVRLQVDVRIGRGLGPVLVRLPLPDTFQLAAGRNVALVWKGPLPAERRLRMDVRAAKRGPAVLGSVEVVAVHPFRLRTEDPVPVTRPVALHVEPRVRKVPRMRHVRGRSVSLLPAGDAASLGARGNDFEEVRGYVHGDPLRSVNWKATARGSSGEALRLMVNEYAHEGRKSVWIFLDAAAYMEVGSTRANALDHAIEGTLGIAAHFVSRGYRLGATVYHQHETRVYYPDVGSRQLARLTEAFAGLTAHAGGEGLDAAALRARGFLLRDRPLVVLVTRPEADPAGTRAGLAQIRALTGHGAVGAPVLLFAPTPIVHTLAGGHHPLAAAALRLAARGTYQDLRRHGVRVLDWDPGTTPIERLLLREMIAR